VHNPLPCLALAIALLLAQVGALLHALSHADVAQDDAGIHAELCGQCLTFSTVLSMAGAPGGPSLLPDLATAVLAIGAIISLVGRAAPQAFRARAPPRLP
jgi:hypothetical protein